MPTVSGMPRALNLNVLLRIQSLPESRLRPAAAAARARVSLSLLATVTHCRTGSGLSRAAERPE